MQVVASVPFVLEEDAELSALIIAPGIAEPSGDDRSLIVFESEEPFSRDRVRKILTDNGFEPAQTISYDDPGRSGAHLYLADVFGFVAPEDPRLDIVRRALSASSAGRVGVYAQPITAGD